MDILIFSGQSNMQGQTESRPNTPDVPNAYEYLHQSMSLVPLNHPVGEALGSDDTHFSHLLLNQSSQKNGSLVPDFCREYTKERGEVLAIHAALGATVINDWQPDTARYAMLVEKVKCGIKTAGEKYPIGHIYFVWLQGESDALAQTTADTYCKKLIIFKNALKKDIGIEKFGIIRVGRFCSLVSGLTEPATHEQRLACDHAIMQAQETAVANDSDFLMLTDIAEELSINSEYINPFAEGHYNNKGMELLGKSAAQGLLRQT